MHTKEAHHNSIELFRKEKEGFKEHLRINNQSAQTITNYRHGIKYFLNWLWRKGIDDLREVNKGIIREYQQYLLEYKTEAGQKYKPNTLSVRLRAIKRFFEYLEKTHQLLYNPAEFIRMPKIGQRLPKEILSKEEVKKILNQPNTSTLIGIRDKTILELLYSTGIRLEELYNLTVYDIDYKAGFLRINKGKGAKDRILPVGNLCCKYLREYIKKVRPELTKKNKEERILFIGRCGKRINKQIIARMVIHYTEQTGIKKRVSCHSWRHACASHLLADGAELVHVQKLLGHSRPDTTQLYTKVIPKEIKQTHTRCHPMEKDHKNDKFQMTDVK